eukprot:IDg218t1
MVRKRRLSIAGTNTSMFQLGTIGSCFKQEYECVAKEHAEIATDEASSCIVGMDAARFTDAHALRFTKKDSREIFACYKKTKYSIQSAKYGLPNTLTLPLYIDFFASVSSTGGVYTAVNVLLSVSPKLLKYCPTDTFNWRNFLYSVKKIFQRASKTVKPAHAAHAAVRTAVLIAEGD